MYPRKPCSSFSTRPRDQVANLPAASHIPGQREPDVTRLLDRMETRTLVSRKRGTTHRRLVHVRITTAALDLVGALAEPVRRMHARSRDAAEG